MQATEMSPKALLDKALARSPEQFPLPEPLLVDALVCRYANRYPKFVKHFRDHDVMIIKENGRLVLRFTNLSLLKEPLSVQIMYSIIGDFFDYKPKDLLFEPYGLVGFQIVTAPGAEPRTNL